MQAAISVSQKGYQWQAIAKLYTNVAAQHCVLVSLMVKSASVAKELGNRYTLWNVASVGAYALFMTA